MYHGLRMLIQKEGVVDKNLGAETLNILQFPNARPNPSGFWHFRTKLNGFDPVQALIKGTPRVILLDGHSQVNSANAVSGIPTDSILN